MMNHMPGGGPPVPHPAHHNPNRRQQEYHYHHPHAQPVPYPQYHHQAPYHGPPMHPYAQQWYPPYPHYAPPMPRHFQQQQAPLVVSSHPNAQPIVPVSRYPPQQPYSPQPPQSIRTPQPEPQSTPSLASQPAVTPSTTPTTNSVNPSTPPVQAPKSTTETAGSPPASPRPIAREPFHPPLPWLSVPESSFPSRTPRRRRKRKVVQLPTSTLELPVREIAQENSTQDSSKGEEQQADITESSNPADVETPQTSLAASAASEAASTEPTTPSSLQPPAVPTPVPNQTHKRTATKPIIPVVPITPITPNVTSPRQKAAPVPVPAGEKTPTVVSNEHADSKADGTGIDSIEEAPVSPPIPIRAPPKSWAELLRSKAPSSNGNVAQLGPAGPVVNGLSPNTSGSLSDALRIYNVGSEAKLSFIEPRGLVNTGNMCYMNSILQILVFCVPFYEFLDQVGKRAAHSFKSDTPLIESMIMFMREFNIIDSASSVEQLRLRLKDNELEQYGEPFVPEYVYDVIKRLPRFSTMRRGHQQDAEEFLGFLLEGLHDECAQIMRGQYAEGIPASSPDIITPPPSEPSTDLTNSPDGGWLEVGPKQKAAVTRSSGALIDTPITKIFGGKLRSEFRVPGLKNSVTLEPYQPLQLDIGEPNVHNITDALKGLTRPETLHGEFNSPRGPGTTAVKQVFIETIPPVLILHLKRFQYETSGTQKIWKKVGYPLELEIPKEVFPLQRRNKYMASPTGLPKYRLIGVVYHHGKSAAGGHYTVDVRRQEGREWVRFDDTYVRRLRSEDVASEGGEEDPRVLQAALENHKRDVSAGRNIYKQAGFYEDADSDAAEDDQGGWSQVNGSSATSPTQPNTKKWSNVANGGTSTPSTAGKQTPKEAKFSIKDNKVAYILLYQQIQN